MEGCTGSWDASDGAESARDHLYSSDLASIGRYSEETPSALRPFTRLRLGGLSHSAVMSPSPPRSPPPPPPPPLRSHLSPPLLSSGSHRAAVGSDACLGEVSLETRKRSWREMIEEFGME